MLATGPGAETLAQQANDFAPATDLDIKAEKAPVVGQRTAVLQQYRAGVALHQLPKRLRHLAGLAKQSVVASDLPDPLQEVVQGAVQVDYPGAELIALVVGERRCVLQHQVQTAHLLVHAVETRQQCLCDVGPEDLQGPLVSLLGFLQSRSQFGLLQPLALALDKALGRNPLAVQALGGQVVLGHIGRQQRPGLSIRAGGARARPLDGRLAGLHPGVHDRVALVQARPMAIYLLRVVQRILPGRALGAGGQRELPG